MNHVSLIGRIVADPELRFTAKGTAVCNIRLARNYRVAEDDERVLFVEVTAWGKLAETVAQHKKQGDQIGVSGRLESSSYTDKDGVKRTKVGIVAENVEFLARKQNGNGKDHPLADPTAAASPEAEEEVIPF